MYRFTHLFGPGIDYGFYFSIQATAVSIMGLLLFNYFVSLYGVTAANAPSCESCCYQ